MTSETPPGPIARVNRSKAAAREWYDRISPWYDVLADPFEGPVRSAGLAVLDVEPGERVLDVGSGTGRALVPMARAAGETGAAVGIDVADGMCRVSRQALQEAGLDRGSVVLGDAANLPFADDSFDAAFASFVLELFDTPEIPAVLAEWRRVLDPDGRLCVVSLSRRDAGLPTRLYEAVHDRLPTYVDCRPIYARETLQEAGFRIVDHRVETVWRFPAEVVLGRVA